MQASGDAAPGLLSTGSVAVANGLSCSAACMRDLPGPGIKPTSLHWQADSLPLSHQGSPLPSLSKEANSFPGM